MSHAIPLQGPLTHPTGPREYSFAHLGQFSPHPPDLSNSPTTGPRRSPKPEPYYPSSVPDAYRRPHEPMPPSPSQEASSSQGPGASGASHYTAAGVPRLPPILQVEKQQVTTSATQLASASRRRNEAHFVCPVPGCGSTFTRRFNLRGPSLSLLVTFSCSLRDIGHLRSHTEERPYVCEWPGCKKGFARQHDCKCVDRSLSTIAASSIFLQETSSTSHRQDADKRLSRVQEGF